MKKKKEIPEKREASEKSKMLPQNQLFDNHLAQTHGTSRTIDQRCTGHNLHRPAVPISSCSNAHDQHTKEYS
ncbi:hypothetical protein KY289_023577 [Solanum tuberosum]|nr:hypothetical protein KY289_023577 [Solanum tuberosum]